MNHQIFERKLHLYLGIGMRGSVLVNKSHIPYGMWKTSVRQVVVFPISLIKSMLDHLSG